MFKITLLTIEEPYKNIQMEFSTSKETINDYCDLYYFCLDRLFLKDETDLSKGLLNVVFLLENWKRKIKQLRKDNPIFLPFDFSDEYIGGLFVFQDSDMWIKYVVTREFTGSMHSPSLIDLISPSENEVITVTDSIKINLEGFYAVIDESIINIYLSLKENTII